ncbi:hypothetical protein DMUE_4668, partial [Dictyocoela muelleri]
ESFIFRFPKNVGLWGEFIRTTRFILTEIFNSDFNNISKITIKNKFENHEFESLSYLLKNEIEKITTINFTAFDLNIDSKRFLSLVENFFGKYKFLSEIEFTFTAFMKTVSIKNLFEIESIRQKITKITINKKNKMNLKNVNLRLPRLKELNVFNSSNIDPFFRNIEFENTLQVLNLNSQVISKNTEEKISKLKSLKKLILINCKFVDESGQMFKSENIQKSLEILILDNFKFGPNRADYIAQMGCLYRLKITKFGFHDINSLLRILSSDKLQNSVKDLTLIDKIRDIGKTKIGLIKALLEIFIPKFSNLKKLDFFITWSETLKVKPILSNKQFQKSITYLKLPISEDINECASFFKYFEVLENIDLSFISISALVSTTLRKILSSENLQKNIKFIKLPCEVIGPIDELLHFQSLESLNLINCKLTEEFCSVFLKCKNFQKSIRVLSLSLNNKIYNCCFDELSNFRVLEKLVLNHHMDLTNDLLYKILSCENLQNILKSLILTNTTLITRQNAEMIGKFKKLEYLSLNYCGFVDNSSYLIYKSENIKKSVKNLDLCLENISSNDIAEISSFERLETLSFNFFRAKIEDINKILLLSLKLKSSLMLINFNGCFESEPDLEIKKKFKIFKVMADF